MQDPSTSSGKLTVLGLLVVGAAPVLGFCLWLLLFAGRSVPAAGGGNVPSIFSPASGHAKALVDLSTFVLAVTGTIFAVVYGLLTMRFSDPGPLPQTPFASRLRCTAAHRSSWLGRSFRC
jgi:hypothetical protein